MKRKLIAAVGAVAMMVSVAACGSDGGDNASKEPKDRKETLTVWLMVDAQSTWPELVKDVNAQFNKKYPGVKVNVQYQQWGDKTKKLDAALAGDKFPDVVELGNTETMTYILNGALGEIDEKKYDNSDTWIGGLKDTCSYEGKMYCVPYYAGARVAIYNKDMFKAATGKDTIPETEADLTKALGKLQTKYGKKDKAFSPLYLPGRYWYAAMSYVAAYGGEIDPAKYENSDTWIQGLKDTCTFEGKQYCVPYYAGARVAIYNKDMFKAGTGSDVLPTTEAELTAALDKVQEKYGKDKAFSPLYLPGRYWYAAMSYVAAYGGEIATYDEGKKEWKSALSTPEAQQGIKHFVDLVDKYNHGDKTKDEQDHANVMANEKAGLLYGNGWESGSVVDSKANGNPKLEGKIGVAGMPGPNGKPLPSFIGGSDLATVSKSKVQDLGEEWISMFTSSKSQEVLASKNILPNNTRQLEPLKAKPETAPIAGAVPDAWFTPIAPGWTSIEKSEVLELMLLDIIKGKSVEEATKKADAEIDKLINEKS